MEASRRSGTRVPGRSRAATVFVPVDKTDFNTPDDEQTLWGIYAQRKPTEGHPGLDLFALGNERPDVTINGTTGNEQRLTLGTRVFATHGVFDYEVEAAIQKGEVGNQDVDAWSFASQVGWKPEGWSGSPRLWFGLDAASGDDASGGDVGTFHQLFPLGHAYFGFIDAVGRQNIIDTSLGGQWSLDEKTTAGFGVHSFRLMETSDALYNAGGAVSRTGFDNSDVGTELDLSATHKVDRHTQIYGGLSRFWAGDGLASTGPDEDTDFLYLGVRTTF
ncbi:MAG: alginate export family protein [Planctomycetota bacterium]